MPIKDPEKNARDVARWNKKHSNPNGVVYKLTNVVTREQYIGSTRAAVKKRWWRHVSAANSGTAGKLYDNIRIWGKECFKLEICHKCSSDEDLKVVEKEWIATVYPKLNTAWRTEC